MVPTGGRGAGGAAQRRGWTGSRWCRGSSSQQQPWQPHHHQQPASARRRTRHAAVDVGGAVEGVKHDGVDAAVRLLDEDGLLLLLRHLGGGSGSGWRAQKGRRVGSRGWGAGGQGLLCSRRGTGAAAQVHCSHRCSSHRRLPPRAAARSFSTAQHPPPRGPHQDAALAGAAQAVLEHLLGRGGGSGRGRAQRQRGCIEQGSLLPWMSPRLLPLAVAHAAAAGCRPGCHCRLPASPLPLPRLQPSAGIGSRRPAALPKRPLAAAAPAAAPRWPARPASSGPRPAATERKWRPARELQTAGAAAAPPPHAQQRSPSPAQPIEPAPPAWPNPRACTFSLPAMPIMPARPA